jgi:hypothetical protein
MSAEHLHKRRNPMTTAASTIPVAPPNPDLVCREGIARTLRRRVANRHVWECSRPRPLLDALVLLSHLGADDRETALWCHSTLIQAVKDDLRTYGWVDGWMPPILFALTEFLEAHNLSCEKGKWVPSKFCQEWRYEDGGWRLYVNGQRV